MGPSTVQPESSPFCHISLRAAASVESTLLGFTFGGGQDAHLGVLVAQGPEGFHGVCDNVLLLLQRGGQEHTAVW